jgi:predicted HTH domain antitoxin
MGVSSNDPTEISHNKSKRPASCTSMTNITLNLPETVFSALRKTPDEFAQEMRIAAAVKWYELEQISQGKAAEIAGLTRAEFIQALSRYQVSPFQYTEADLLRELNHDE